jgi:hypothetical protein
MALSVTVTAVNNIGNKRLAVGTLALDSSYQAGGYTLTHDAFGLMYIDSIICNGGGYTYQVVSGKLKVWTSAGVEASGNLSSVTGVNFVAIGS